MRASSGSGPSAVALCFKASGVITHGGRRTSGVTLGKLSLRPSTSVLESEASYPWAVVLCGGWLYRLVDLRLVGGATGPTLRTVGLVGAPTALLSGAIGGMICDGVVVGFASSSSEVSSSVLFFWVSRFGAVAESNWRRLENFPGSGGWLTWLTWLTSLGES